MTENTKSSAISIWFKCSYSSWMGRMRLVHLKSRGNAVFAQFRVECVFAYILYYGANMICSSRGEIQH